MATDSRLLGGRYQLGEILGFGGMAEVHRARDLRLGREVAVKTLRADLARDPAFQARFRREAHSAAALNHPSIVAVYDTGDEAGQDGAAPYIVMEYVEGQTLREVLAVERRLPWRRALEIVAQVAQALNYSHRQGIVHRDIKPANVMLTAAGEVKVMDFGIARALTSATATVTQTAAVIGTAQYLSPEQARGEPVDARSDLYSTGCLLYELVTGSPPFTGDSPVAVAYQHVREDPVPPSQLIADLPPVVDAIVLKAMAKNPVNRYQSAAELRADCERALAGGPVTATPLLDQDTVLLGTGAAAATTTLLRPPRPRRRRGTGYLLLALLALAVLVGGYLVTRSLVGPGTIAVPSVKGDTLAQAQAALERAGLKLGQRGSRESTAPRGTVIDQEPTPGTEVPKGTAVDVVLSAGVAQIPVPNLVGSTRDAAGTLLKSSRLQLGRATARPSSQPAGTVIGQNPKSGTPVAPGTPVDIIVASGSNAVPTVVGKDEATAQQLLRDAGFSVNTTSVPDATHPAGTVLTQLPAPNTTLPVGSAVTITVAQAPPAPSPTPTPSPSPSPPSPSPTASPSPSPTSTSPSPPPAAG